MGILLIFIDNTLVNDAAIKEYGIGAQILKALKVQKINLISTKKLKEINALSGFGLEISKEIILRWGFNKRVKNSLKIKQN